MYVRSIIDDKRASVLVKKYATSAHNFAADESHLFHTHACNRKNRDSNRYPLHYITIFGHNESRMSVINGTINKDNDDTLL
mmetsp:Transcript_1248/g.1905  ORF Transcript_1248/g.1905 Transcript_1248/m.1905 type:complete len:81 (-) Transcript_1248:11-253(-)